MSNATHTPGSWRVDPNFSGDIQTADGLLEIGRALRAEGGGQVVTLPSNAPPAKEAEANARLIAAAPDLLEALQVVRSCEPLWFHGGELAENYPEHEMAGLVAMKQRIESAIAKATATEPAQAQTSYEHP